jgi:hypothetical protein
MLRLTVLLLAGIGVAMLIAGRGLSPEETAALGNKRPAAVGRASVAAVQVPEVPLRPAPAAEVATVAPPAAAAGQAASPDAVADAVRLALAQDLTETPASGSPAGESPVDLAAITPPAPEAVLPPSVADEIETALAESQVWYVTGKVVNVREGPDTSFPVVGKVVYGEATEILSDPSDDWVRIRIQGDGIEGYMARRFLQDSEPNG